MNYDTRVDTINALAERFQPKSKSPENIVEINSLWIPVEKRIPNQEEVKRHNGKFLVCRADGGIFIDDFKVISQNNETGRWIVIESAKVVAWMNLPDAYVAPAE